MKFYGLLGIIMGTFLLISVIFLFKKDENKNKIKIDLIIYSICGIILLTIGILSFIDLFKYQGVIYTGSMLVLLIAFFVYITISDKKGKKIVKYKMTGHGKNKTMVEAKEKFEDKK